MVGWGSFRLESGLAGDQVDASLAGDAIADLFDRAGLSRRHVVGALPGWGSRSALLDIPPTRRQSELEELLGEIAGQQLGHVPAKTYLFWQRATGRRRTRPVFAVVVPREPLLLALEALETAGVQPDALDLKPLALARAVNRRDAIIASLDPNGLDVVIVSDDLPAVVRSLPLGPGTTSRAARERLVSEVVRALAGYGGARALLAAEARIYLAGQDVDGALGDQLRLQTGHEVGTLEASLRFPPDFPLAAQLANVGLALKGQ